MQPPDRITVPTCIGCGAMGLIGSCAGGCAEQKLELVRGVEYDALMALADSARARSHAFRTAARALVAPERDADESEPAYRAAQDRARAVLRRYSDLDARDVSVEQQAEYATTWWCDRCGAIDAPQPCLGICLWRPIEWVNGTRYVQQRARALAELDTERRLRRLLRRVAWVTPREGQWERSWRVLRDEARDALAACEDG